MRIPCAAAIIQILTWLAPVAWGDAPAGAESTRAPVANLLHESPGTSEAFRRQIRSAMDSVPQNVWTGLHRAGWRVHTVAFVLDAAPSLKGSQPRGWPQQLTWDNTDAVHLPKFRKVVVAEKLRTRTGEVFPSLRVEGNLRHEVGHAFDMLSEGSSGFRSSSAQFLKAFRQDWSAVQSDDRTALTYYSQSHKAGPQETFAEAFAIHLGGGSDPKNRKRFLGAFPSVLEYVRSAVDDY